MRRTLRVVGGFTGGIALVTILLLLGAFVVWEFWPRRQEPPTFDVAGAREAGAGEMTVVGDLYLESGRTPLLCEQVRKADGRPRCTGESIRIQDLWNSPAAEPGYSGPEPFGAPGDVRTKEDVEVYGRLEEGVLTVPPLTG